MNFRLIVLGACVAAIAGQSAFAQLKPSQAASAPAQTAVPKLPAELPAPGTPFPPSLMTPEIRAKVTAPGKPEAAPAQARNTMPAPAGRAVSVNVAAVLGRAASEVVQSIAAAPNDAARLAAIGRSDTRVAAAIGQGFIAKTESVQFVRTNVGQTLGAILLAGPNAGARRDVVGTGAVATALVLHNADNAAIEALANYGRARGERVKLLIEVSSARRQLELGALQLVGGAVVSAETKLGQFDQVILGSIEPVQRTAGHHMPQAVAAAQPSATDPARPLARQLPAAGTPAPAAGLQACEDKGNFITRGFCEAQACAAQPELSRHPVCIRVAEQNARTAAAQQGAN